MPAMCDHAADGSEKGDTTIDDGIVQDRRFDVNYIDDKSDLTHFHAACKYSCKEVVKEFLDLGQDPNCLAQESNASTIDPPLLVVLKHDCKELVELLLRRGANPNLSNKEGLTFLHIVCTRQNDDEFSKIFFDFNDEVHQPIKIDPQDNSGDTPLHKALSWENKKLAELLLKRGANMNITNSHGETPLHIICDKYYDVNFVELLLKIADDQHQTVQVDAQDYQGRTPLFLAIENGRMKVAELLLRRGANPNLVNAYGSTPLHVTIQHGYYVEEVMFLKIFFEIADANHQTVRVDAKDHLGQHRCN
ncbi:unnamed protein product [Trichogramma brassicae]|uniref:Uncharacterized protein n=1 Tax=Trichogramma brassicae TaxID=86971 RepID=A0A6H5J4B9_9HYME|nr:unnamed protein product [Trichogramma brassicae]